MKVWRFPGQSEAIRDAIAERQAMERAMNRRAWCAGIATAAITGALGFWIGRETVAAATDAESAGDGARFDDLVAWANDLARRVRAGDDGADAEVLRRRDAIVQTTLSGAPTDETLWWLNAHLAQLLVEDETLSALDRRLTAKKLVRLLDSHSPPPGSELPRFRTRLEQLVR